MRVLLITLLACISIVVVMLILSASMFVARDIGLIASNSLIPLRMLDASAFMLIVTAFLAVVTMIIWLWGEIL